MRGSFLYVSLRIFGVPILLLYYFLFQLFIKNKKWELLKGDAFVAICFVIIYFLFYWFLLS